MQNVDGQRLLFTGEHYDMISAYATERGLTVEEGAEELFWKAIEEKSEKVARNASTLFSPFDNLIGKKEQPCEVVMFRRRTDKQEPE